MELGCITPQYEDCSPTWRLPVLLECRGRPMCSPPQCGEREAGLQTSHLLSRSHLSGDSPARPPLPLPMMLRCSDHRPQGCVPGWGWTAIGYILYFLTNPACVYFSNFTKRGSRGISMETSIFFFPPPTLITRASEFLSPQSCQNISHPCAFPSFPGLSRGPSRSVPLPLCPFVLQADSTSLQRDGTSAPQQGTPRDAVLAGTPGGGPTAPASLCPTSRHLRVGPKLSL